MVDATIGVGFFSFYVHEMLPWQCKEILEVKSLKPCCIIRSGLENLGYLVVQSVDLAVARRKKKHWQFCINIDTKHMITVVMVTVVSKRMVVISVPIIIPILLLLIICKYYLAAFKSLYSK